MVVAARLVFVDEETVVVVDPEDAAEAFVLFVEAADMVEFLPCAIVKVPTLVVVMSSLAFVGAGRPVIGYIDEAERE